MVTVAYAIPAHHGLSWLVGLYGGNCMTGSNGAKQRNSAIFMQPDHARVADDGSNLRKRNYNNIGPNRIWFEEIRGRGW